MSTIQNLFQQAQLAEAAYADFSDPLKTKLQALEDSGFSAAQATAFTDEWTVVDQYTASAWGGLTDGSGFSGSKGSASHLISQAHHATSPTH